MISHVGLLPRLSQSEWIWNRVILTRQQSPAVQSSYLQSRSPKELEVQDRIVRIAMRRLLDEGNTKVFAEKNISKQIFQLDFEKRSKVVTFLADEGQVLLSFKKLL